MALQDQLDALKHEFETNLAPPAVVEAIHRSTDELIASGQAERALKAGDRAPDFALADADGNQVSLSDLLAKGPVVLTFYRGVWCPYCNLDLKALEAAATEIRARGASLAAVSQQTAPNSRKAQRIEGLSFPILADPGGQVGDAFGLRFQIPDYLKATYLQLKVDLSVINGEASWTLPMPARYVIGTDGVVAYAEVNPDYTRRPDPSELLPVLDRLAAAKAA
ncbi:peroxiredoxin-like family protein [Caulobacter sp. KR2-114]|uniref:peroxiredoxin-like family protein n=1 Tax=Caulobacter sp. KR2-114 TaxID=3400912 RepID=UPI003BFF1D5C